jgi:hypothetical protein
MNGRAEGMLKLLVAAAVMVVAALAVGGSQAAQQDAVVVEGSGASLTGVVRDDVERVLVVRMDGVEQEVAIAADGSFAYDADTPDHVARSLTARAASGAVLSALVLTPAPACGGAAGPCPQASAGRAADDIRAFDRPATATDRLPERIAQSFRRRGTRLSDSRQIARYRDGRGRLHRLFASRGHDAERREVICQILVRANGHGSGCSPSSGFFGSGRRVAASSGRLMWGFVARDVARVVVVGTQGRLHPVALTTDGGFIWNCRAYNGCACVVAELHAFDDRGRLVTRQNWRAASCAAGRRPSAATGAQAPTPRGYTVGNRGREVPRGQQRGDYFEGHPYRLFLLGTRRGRAFYRIQVTPRYTCWGSGAAARIGEIGSLGCPTLVGAYPLQNEDIALRMERGSRRREYLRIGGVAVDQAATIALADENGRHVATTEVTNNLFAFPRPYPSTPVRIVVLDDRGKVLEPHPEWGQRQTPPQGLWGLPATRVAKPTLASPVQAGAARGVRLQVGANGVVVFDGRSIEPKARKLLANGRIGSRCFVLSENHRRTRSAGISGAWEPTIAFKVLKFKPPFDGCELQGTYGHRWRDQYGPHSVVEIALTPRARRYFENRAAARDLALFVRSRKTQQLRKQTGPALIAALRRAYGGAVVVLSTEKEAAPARVVGVWTSGRRTIFSERSTVGVRFYVELVDGKITKETVRGLAFVF